LIIVTFVVAPATELVHWKSAGPPGEFTLKNCFEVCPTGAVRNRLDGASARLADGGPKTVNVA